jgi:hypothetical protein
MEINKHRKKGSFVRHHSLSLALLFVFLAQAIIVWFTGYSDWMGQQKIDNASVAIWLDYLIHYVYEMAVSLVANTYGALLLVLFAKWFYEKGSPESGDENDN